MACSTCLRSWRRNDQRKIGELCDEIGEEILLADGFEEAFLGIAWQFTKPMALYDRQKCIDILMKRDGMTDEEATEYFDFNVAGAYVGENTPAFLTRAEE